MNNILRNRRCRVSPPRRTYSAEALVPGMLVVDPDGRLGLHEKQVRVAAEPRPLDIYDHTNVIVDWEVPGTNITGTFHAARLAPVWVMGGDGR